MNPTKKIILAATVLCVVSFGSSQHYDADYKDSYSAESDASEEKVDDAGFVTPLDFSPLFGGEQFGLSGAASNPASNILQAVPQQYSSLFDYGGAKSAEAGQDFFQGQASDKQFSPESFGFQPTFSRGLAYASAPAAVVPKKYFENSVQLERTKASTKSAAVTRAPLQYNLQTKHDNTYLKSQQESEKAAPLASYKDKSVSQYSSPVAAEYQVNHPSESSQLKSGDHLTSYKKYGFQPQGNFAPIAGYQPLSSGYPGNYLGNYPGSPSQIGSDDFKVYRYKRYSGDKKKPKARNAKLQKQEEEDEDADSPYNYHADYKSRPKEFDEGGLYDSSDFGGFGDDKAELKKYDYGSDEDYNSDEYERIKGLSEQQAAEVKKNPENCKQEVRDTMTCQVCKNPKTGGSYESCAYVSEPKNNKYAYVKEQKFDSDDEPENQENSDESKVQPAKSEKPTSSPYAGSSSKNSKPSRGNARYQQNSKNQKQSAYNPPKYDKYYEDNPIAEATKATYAAYKDNSNEEEEEEDDEDDDGKYKSSLEGFFTDNEQKKNVEHVLAEFAKKDRSACKKVYKNEMTCYQCTDNKGLKNEECMFVSESAPKSSHLAYKEIKEFNSKPENQNHEAESKIIPTSKPAPILYPIPTGIFSTESTYSKQKKNPNFKKYSLNDESTGKKSLISSPSEKISSSYVQSPTIVTRLDGLSKRHARSPNNRRVRNTREKAPREVQPTKTAELDDIADPTDFAGEESKGAFWADTIPQYSKLLGVSLPKYMLAKSEQEKIFDEILSSG